MCTAQWLKTRRSGLKLRAYLKIGYRVRLVWKYPALFIIGTVVEKKHKPRVGPRKNANRASEICFLSYSLLSMYYCDALFHSPTCNTLSTQPPSTRVTPRRKGSWVSSLLSPLDPLSSPPALKEEYIQISFSLLGNDQ